MQEETRVLVLGAPATGKSCLTLRFVNRLFYPDYGPTIEEQLRAPVRTRRGPQSLLILDSAPLEGYRHVLELYSRAAHGFVFVYSITARDTFVEAFQLIDGIHELRKRGRIAGVLVGNKSDLESQRATTLEEGQQLAERYGLAFFETSAKSAMHVDEAFRQCAEEAAALAESRRKKARCGLQ